MSSRKSIEWIERLLFGSHHHANDYPPELLPVISRLQAKGLSISDVIRNGGLVNTQSLMIGDLDRCLEHFERNDEEPTFQTGAVTRFYNQMSVILARRRAESVDEESSDDSTIFESILREDDASKRYPYHSSRYWGELARRLLNERRPVRGLDPSTDSIPDRYLRNVVRLYDITIKTLGKRIDPLTMYLLPHKKGYVDPVHFASSTALDAFLRLQPEHPLTQSIQSMLHRCIDELLEGRLCLHGRHEQLEKFLTNVLVVHDYLHQVKGENEPPRLVDVFQRLLAMTQLDYLWERPGGETSKTSESPSVVFELTSKIQALEKQNAFLFDHINKLSNNKA